MLRELLGFTTLVAILFFSGILHPLVPLDQLIITVWMGLATVIIISGWKFALGFDSLKFVLLTIVVGGFAAVIALTPIIALGPLVETGVIDNTETLDDDYGAAIFLSIVSAAIGYGIAEIYPEYFD